MKSTEQIMNEVARAASKKAHKLLETYYDEAQSELIAFEDIDKELDAQILKLQEKKTVNAIDIKRSKAKVVEIKNSLVNSIGSRYNLTLTHKYDGATGPAGGKGL